MQVETMSGRSESDGCGCLVECAVESVLGAGVDGEIGDIFTS